MKFYKCSQKWFQGFWKPDLSLMIIIPGKLQIELIKQVFMSFELY